MAEKKIPTIFVFANGDDGYSIEEAVFRDAIAQHNWWFQSTEYWPLDAEESKLVDTAIQNYGIHNVIPVGPIDFVTQFCRDHGVPEPVALNVPPELCKERYLRRKIWTNMSKENIQTLPKDSYLVKPGEHPKRFEATLFSHRPDDLKSIPDDEPLFVSELFRDNIVAEWRLFVHRSKIIAAQPYQLDFAKGEMPDKQMCQAMALQMWQYPAITLDVAVLESGPTVLIEAHSFISCGLYGLEGPDVALLAKAAWQSLCGKKEDAE